MAAMLLVKCLLFLSLLPEATSRGQKVPLGCSIPVGPDYDKAMYRLMYGDDIDPLPAGEVIPHKVSVMVVCNNDMDFDAIMEYSFSQCRDGRWHPELPPCTPGYRPCKGVPDVPLATTSFDANATYEDGAKVSYTCNPGYRAQGRTERQCFSGLWSEVTFQCVDNATMAACLTRGIPNGKLSANNESNNFHIECDIGFTISGGSDVICANGSWLPNTAKCVPEVCPSIENYTVLSPGVSTESDFTHRTKLLVICGQGFLPLFGRRKAVCRHGDWKPRKPICYRACQVSGAVPGSHLMYRYQRTRGRVHVARGVPHGRRVVVTCRPGWKRVPNVERASLCLKGRWKPPLQTATCTAEKSFKLEIKKCELPGIAEPSEEFFAAENMTSLPPGGRVEPGDAVAVVCRPGYSLALSSSNISVCQDGDWEPELTHCVQGCRDDQFVCANGTCVDGSWRCDSVPNCEDESDEDDCGCQDDQFMCANGTCLESGWRCDGVPNCEDESDEIGCDPPECTVPVSEAVVWMNNEIVHPGRNVTNGSVVSVSCAHLHSNFTAVCLKGKWTDDFTNCTDEPLVVDCQPPYLPDVTYSPSRDVYPVGSVVWPECCQNDLHLVGSTELVCMTSLTWQGNASCVRFCERGVEVKYPTIFTGFDRLAIDYRYVGEVELYETCWRMCVEETSFLCRAVKLDQTSGRLNCSLLAEPASEESGLFLTEHKGSRVEIINRGCIDMCDLPRDPDMTFRNQHDRPQRRVKSFPDGTTLSVHCDSANLSPPVPFITCLGGQWDNSGPYCALPNE